MSKIGIAIKITSAGSGQPIVINGGDWTKRVIDIRDILKHIPSMVSEHSKICIFASFIEDACLLTVARTVSGRPWDNVAGWIHIPSNLVITGQEVTSVISKVKKLISATELPEDAELKKMFEEEYETKRISARYEASKRDGRCAKRDTVIYSLEELLGENRYQSYYSEYSVVFFSSDVDSIVDAHDISNKPLTSLITFIPPTTKDIQSKLGRYVTIRFASGQIFNDAILLNKNDNIDLIAVREGFEPQRFMVTAEKDGQICELPRIAWRKKVGSSLFEVKSESGKSLDGKASISINDIDISTRPHSFSESECMNAYVVVAANGYETYKSKMNVLVNGRISVILERKVEEYRKRIQLKNGYLGEITVSGKGIDRYHSPIKGYVDSDGCLEYMPGNVWVQRLIGFGVAVAIWLVVLFIGWWNSVEFKTTSNFPWIETVSKEAKRATVEAPSQYGYEDNQIIDNNDNPSGGKDETFDFEAAINYLETHEVWEKSELEKYPDLKGLFDDLNNMDTYKLSYTWQEKLKDSNNFQKVARSAKKNCSRGWNPKQEPHNPTYNKADDYQINLTNYVNWLDSDQTPKTDSPTKSTSSRLKDKGKEKTSTTKSENKFDAKNLN